MPQNETMADFPTSEGSELTDVLYNLPNLDGDGHVMSAKTGSWMHHVVDEFSDMHGANISKGARACYNRSLQILRQDYEGEDGPLQDLRDINRMGRRLASFVPCHARDDDKMLENLSDVHHGHDFSAKPRFEESLSFRIKDSIIAESMDSYSKLLGMNKSEMIRCFVAIPLVEYPHAGPKHKKRSESFRTMFDEAYSKARETKERAVADFILKNAWVWNRKGIRREDAQRAHQVVQMMDYVNEEKAEQAHQCIKSLDKNDAYNL